MFPIPGTDKRYFSFDAYCKKRFGGKLAKLPIDGGFTCPNRDGLKGRGGCAYCSGRGSGDFASSPLLSVADQIQEQKRILSAKWNPIGYIAYFQAHTNTYAPLQVLREKYEAALACEGIIGLSIATRADCLSEDVLAYLGVLRERTFLTVELGLQTIHDQTAARINRCHSYMDFVHGISRLSAYHIRTCVHLINGLPGETHAMMVESAREVGDLPISAIKLHSLHVLRNTPLEQEYRHKNFSMLTQEEYISVVCDQLELLPPQTVIERLTGDGNQTELIAPEWSRNKRKILNGIDRELSQRNTFQGFLRISK